MAKVKCPLCGCKATEEQMNKTAQEMEQKREQKIDVGYESYYKGKCKVCGNNLPLRKVAKYSISHIIGVPLWGCIKATLRMCIFICPNGCPGRTPDEEGYVGGILHHPHGYPPGIA